MLMFLNMPRFRGAIRMSAAALLWQQLGLDKLLSQNGNAVRIEIATAVVPQ